MKKILLFFVLLSVAGFSQTYKDAKLVSNVRLVAGTYRYVIPIPVANTATGETYPYKWQIWCEYISHKDTTKHSYIQVQQMGTDNTGTINWLNYAGLSADSMKHISTVTAVASAFEDPFGLCGRKLSLKAFIGTVDTVTISVWYTIKK